MDIIEQFKKEREESIIKMNEDKQVKKKSLDWINEVGKYKYSYNFSWLGRPIIQFPTDMIAIQELIWKIKPDLIIETGIAHGGSIIFSASILELIGGDGEVIGIDIDIRNHNKVEIEKHPMFKRIKMVEGSSIDTKVVNEIKKMSKYKKKIMVFLDSCHTHEHVLNEIEIYSQFVSVDSYLIVFDTSVEFISDELSNDRPWGVGNNPWTATQEFIKKNDHFIIDKKIQNKLLITAAIDGYLRRIK